MKLIPSALSVLCTAAALMAAPGAPEMKRPQVPFSFEANQGQTDPAVRYLARGSRQTLFATRNAVVLSLTPRSGPAVAIRTRFPGSNSNASIVPSSALVTRSNYYFGPDSKKWITGVPHFARLDYQNLYPGIDLALYGSGARLEYDFVLAPGADPNRIRLQFDGTQSLAIADDGALLLNTAAGVIRERKPDIYQSVSGKKTAVAGRFIKTGPNVAGFEIAAYDHSRPLIIDPVLQYSTLLGGTLYDEGDALGIDNSGNAYVAGLTSSSDFPYSTGQQSTTPAGLDDVFVAKFSADGSQLLYADFLGSTPNGYPPVLAVDFAGNAYVMITTGSTNFPVTPGSLQSTFKGNADAALAKLDPSGRILAATYLGGSGTEYAQAIAVGSDGSVYAALDSDNPTNFGLQSASTRVGPRGSRDVVIVKLSTDLGRIVYQNIMGGGGDDVPHGIQVDNAGAVYISGRTVSTNLPVTSGVVQSKNNGSNDAFAAKLNPDGVNWAYITYLGGKGDDYGYGAAVDSAGNFFFVAQTNSTNFPVSSGAYRASFGNGPSDLAVVKLNPSGSSLVFSTYLGGSDEEDPGLVPIAVDANGNAYVFGTTLSTDFATTGGTLESMPSSQAAFVVKFTPTGQVPSSTFLGGTQGTAANAIAVDSKGLVYVTGLDYSGYQTSSNFPITANAYQSDSTDCLANDQNGCYHAFLSKIDFSVEVPAGPRVFWNGVVDAGSYGPVQIAPGAIIDIFGTSLGGATLTGLQLDSAGNIATTLNGTSVLLNGTPLPLVYSSATQVSAIITQNVLEALDATVPINTAQLSVCYNGQCSQAQVLARYETDAALFTANSSGTGPGAILNQDSTVNSSSNAAARNSVISLFGTGAGGTAGSPSAAGLTPRSPLPAFRDVNVQVTIDGKLATVQYAGPAPGLVPGVFQINVVVPANATVGANDQVQVTLFDKSNATTSIDQTQIVTVAVK